MAPPQTPHKKRSPLLRLIKVVLMLAGLGGTLLCLMSVIGMLTDVFWVRAAGSAVVAIAIPAFIADRLLPETDPKPTGLVTNVFAAIWVIFPVVFLVAARDYTRRLMVAEGDRLVTDGYGEVGAATHLLAGGRPSQPTPDASAAVPSMAASSRPSATAVAPTKLAQATGTPTVAKPNGSARASAETTTEARSDTLPPFPDRGSQRKDCKYPSGPYGLEVGDTLSPAFRWEGFAPGSNEATTVVSRDLFDCDGKGGIRAVVIDTSQYG